MTVSSGATLLRLTRFHCHFFHRSHRLLLWWPADSGESWTAPAELFPGNLSDPLSQWHCAPTPVLFASDGRLYKAFETTQQGSGYTAVLLSAPQAGADLLSAASWRMQPSARVLSFCCTPLYL